MARRIPSYDSYTRQFDWTPRFNLGKPDEEYVNTLYEGMNQPYQSSMQIDEGRSLLDRTFDTLSTPNYMIAGFAKGLFDNDAPDGGVTPWQGMVDGLKAGNPFGDGYQKGETTFSDVIGHMGWQPTSTFGKIAKGTVGLGLDILLDPTTYLTGGLSAVVKGTGKVGKAGSSLAKMVEGVKKSHFDEVVKDLTSKGVNPDLAERFATKKTLDAFGHTEDATHMTDSMAEQIIKNQNAERGFQMSTDEVKNSAKSFANQYNKQLGLRSGEHAKPITFGVENLPFGEKLAPKLGVLGKTLTLSDGNSARAFGDKSGLALAYSSLRDSIYGSKIGKLFSTNAKLHGLAQENPAKLFDFVKFTEYTRGLNADKLAGEKAIRDKAKTLNMTPDETSEVLKLMQDKTIWHQVTEAVKFSDLQQVKEMKKAFESDKAKKEIELKDIKEKRAHYETMKHMAETGLHEGQDTLKKMQEEYRDSLVNLNLKHKGNLNDLHEIKTAIQKELDGLDKEERSLISKSQKTYRNEINKMVERNGVVERHLQNKVNKAQEKVNEVQKKVNPENLLPDLVLKKFDEFNVQNAENKINAQAKNDLNGRILDGSEEEQTLIENAKKGMDKSAHKELVDLISILAYGQKGYLNLDTRYANINELVDLVKKTKPEDYDNLPKQLRDTMEKNPTAYNGKMKEVQSEIGRIMGYGDNSEVKNIDELLFKPIERFKELLTKKNEGTTLSEKEAKELSDLQAREGELSQTQLRYNMLKGKFYGMSDYEWKEYKKTIANQELMQTFWETNARLNPSEQASTTIDRSTFIDDVTSSEGRKNFDTSSFDPHDVSTPEARGEIVSHILGFVQEKQGALSDNAIKYSQQVADEVVKNLQSNIKKSFSDLSRAQKDMVVKKAFQDVFKKPSKTPADKSFQDEVEAIKQEFIKRTFKEQDSLMSKHITKGHIVHWHDGNRLRAGDVVGVRSTPDGAIYDVEVRGQKFELRSNDILGVGKEKMTPEQLVMSSPVAKDHVEEMKSLSDELGKAQEHLDLHRTVSEDIIKRHKKERLQTTKSIRERFQQTRAVKEGEIQGTDEAITHITEEYEQSKMELLEHFRTRAESQKYVLEDLEDSYRKYDELLKSADMNTTKIEESIVKYEDLLSSDDALETYLRSSSKADVELLKDPNRYTRNTEFVEDMKSYGMSDSTLAFANGSKVFINKKRWDSLSPKDAYKHLMHFKDELIAKGWSAERINKTLNTMDKTKKTQQYVMEHELSHIKNQDHLKANTNDYADPIVKQYEGRANVDALDMVENFDVDKWIASAGRVDTGKWILRSDLSASEKVKNIVTDLQREFELMGRDEVGIGKLDKEAFEALLRQYVPHIPTTEGALHLRSMRELQEHQTAITQDLGYGMEYNQFAKSRTTKGTIEELNAHFKDVLQGKNLFQENIADIYLARALKHNELMYDHQYMEEMMNVFGKDIDLANGVEDGYKAVVNVGVLKETSTKLAGYLTSMHISNAISAYLKENHKMITASAIMAHIDKNTLIQKAIEQFMKDKFPLEKQREISKSYWNDLLKHNQLPDSDNFAKTVTPMVELKEEQIQTLSDTFTHVMAEFENHLNTKIANATIRGDMTRVKVLQDKLSDMKNTLPFNVKQVNDVIVDKANQTRKLSQMKDESRFLQIYDKFLHFMKLNQTTVMPSFHIRNKLSNTYLNWLGVGKDAVNPQLQKATWMTVHHLGDAEKLKGLKPLISDDGNTVWHWNDLYELAKAHNVIDEGFFAKDLGAESASKGLFKKLNTRTKDGKFVGLDPTDTENFSLYQKGANIGSKVENSDRLLHFASLLKQGKSVEEASASATKFLFDYSDLTGFEKSVMKRIIPYYTWLRKNTRLQAGEFINQPGKFRDVAKVSNGITHMNSEEERMNDSYINDFARDWIQTPFSKNTVHTNKDGSVVEGKEPIMLSPNLPFMDIARIPDPSQPLQSAKELFAQTAPQIKVPLELMANRNVFFDSPITKEGENPIVEGGKHILGQFALANAVGGATGTQDDGDALRSIMSTLTGVKTMSYDYETAKGMRMAEMLKKIKDK